MVWNGENLLKILKEGGIAVMPTDTLYGIVGRAEDQQVVERIYKVRKRSPEKPCIILLGGTSELQKFAVVLTSEQKKEIAKIRNGARPTSFVLDCQEKRFEYLHRGTNTLAFRVPAQAELKDVLKKTGPLIAPSANPEGLPPAQNIAEAKKYFGSEVDLYINGGEIKNKASKVIKLHRDGSDEVLRP